MRTKLLCLTTLLTVLFVSSVASAQEKEEVTLTTYYPAPYGDYAGLTISGNAVSPPLNVTPTLTATDHNDVLTAVHIRPTFRDSGFQDVHHNVLIIEDGNVGIGTTNPQARLEVAGEAVFAPTTLPATPRPGMIYYDQTNHIMRYYKGGPTPGWVEMSAGAEGTGGGTGGSPGTGETGYSTTGETGYSTTGETGYPTIWQTWGTWHEDMRAKQQALFGDMEVQRRILQTMIKDMQAKQQAMFEDMRGRQETLQAMIAEMQAKQRDLFGNTQPAIPSIPSTPSQPSTPSGPSSIWDRLFKR